MRTTWQLDRMFDELPNGLHAELKAAWMALKNVDEFRELHAVGDPGRVLNPQQLREFWRGWQLSHQEIP